MDAKAYLCPNCNANRTKFRLIRRSVQQIQKDAFNGVVVEQGLEEPYISEQGEKEVECLACHYVGYEMMFIKAAERDPRERTVVEGRI